MRSGENEAFAARERPAAAAAAAPPMRKASATPRGPREVSAGESARLERNEALRQAKAVAELRIIHMIPADCAYDLGKSHI